MRQGAAGHVRLVHRSGRNLVEKRLGPPLPLTIPPVSDLAFCHGDWTDGNLLASDARISAVVDWESAHLGDPIRDLSRAAWGAARKDPRALDAMVAAYGHGPRPGARVAAHPRRRTVGVVRRDRTARVPGSAHGRAAVVGRGVNPVS